VRNKKAADEKFAKAGYKNVTTLQAAVNDAKAMQAAADAVSKATGGSLDILIPNAGIGGEKHRFKTLPNFPSLEELEEELNETFSVNVVGAAFTISAFIPLLRKGQTKKIAAISSAMGSDGLINKYEIPTAAPYSVSKGALNTLIAKYNVALKREGILCFAISPGFVATDMNSQDGMTEEGIEAGKEMGAAFFKLKPDWSGQPITAEESIRLMDDVIKNATIEKDGGVMVSQHGNTTEWL
jgi:NAD(P)-dependent dehydrogenase (short-subunit alcohol dehydrogenase family)